MEIAIQGAQTALFKTALIFGDSGCGKSYFVAGLPRVAWIGSMREDGFETIRNMDPRAWYDPKVPPKLFGVSSMSEMMGHLVKDIFPAAARGVFDSLAIEMTFYAADIVRNLEDENMNGWDVYRNLEAHIDSLDKRTKSLPKLRVWYNTLVLPEANVKGTAGALIPGKAAARKLPAMCSLVGLLRQEAAETGTDRVLHMAAYGAYTPRHRYGARLPTLVRWPSDGTTCQYRDLEDLYRGTATVDASGYVQRLERKVTSLPPLKGLAK